MNNMGDIPLKLCGFVPIADNGFALPVYTSRKDANALYVAISDIDGDHSSVIDHFELFDDEGFLPLPTPHLEVSEGDPWHDVFLCQEKVFVGHPRKILQRVNSLRHHLIEVAPLSFLDLALAAKAPVATHIVASVRAFLGDRLGSKIGSHEFREIVIRSGVLLEIQRHKKRRNLVADLSLLARIFAISEIDTTTFRVLFLPELTSLMGDGSQRYNLFKSIKCFGETLGINFRIDGLIENEDDFSDSSQDIVPAEFPFFPTEDLIDEARNGRMFILVDDERPENEGDLIIPAQMATPDAINFMAKYGRGLICLALTQERIEQLGLSMMNHNNGTSNETAFTVSIEASSGVTLGISAADRARTVAVALYSSKPAQDIVTPGHVFPLVARPGGVLIRAGHAEAAVDISRLAGIHPSAVICEIMADDGTMMRVKDIFSFAQQHKIRVGTIRDLIAYRFKHDNDSHWSDPSPEISRN